MQKLKAKMLGIKVDYTTGETIMSLNITPEHRNYATNLVYGFLQSDKYLAVDIKQWKKQRSKDANAYCWSLCDAIARTDILGILTKEDVYRHNILEVGIYETLQISDEALNNFKMRWECKGTGWIIEVVDDDVVPGNKLIHAYFGSSTYSTQEMARLIKHIEQDAKAVDIPTFSERELDKMLKDWK